MAKGLTRAREISINRKGATGLSGMEIDEILATLRRAKAKGTLPALTYEANRRTWLFGKDPMYVKPKTGSLARTAVKVRQVLKAKYGTKYTVRLL